MSGCLLKEFCASGRHGTRTETLPIYIVADPLKNVSVLLGRDWLEKLQLQWGRVRQVAEMSATSSQVQELKDKFPAVFSSEMGLVKSFRAQIVIKKGRECDNAVAEILVHTTKKALLKQVLEERVTAQKKTLQDSPCSFHMAYRNTPTCSTGRTHAVLFFKRQPRRKLALLKPDFLNDMKLRQERVKERMDQRRGPSSRFTAGDHVYIKTTRGKRHSWDEGIIERVVSPVTYRLRRGNQVHFTHLDHIRARRVCSSKNPSEPFPLTSPIMNAQQAVHPVQQTVPSNVETLPQESSSCEAFTPVQAANKLPELWLAPEIVQPTPQPTSCATATLTPQPTLRRSGRTVKPPDRHGSSNYSK